MKRGRLGSCFYYLQFLVGSTRQHFLDSLDGLVSCSSVNYSMRPLWSRCGRAPFLVGGRFMSGEIGCRNTNREMTRRCLGQRALAFLAIAVAAFSTHVGSAKSLHAQLSNVANDGSPLAIGLKVLTSKKSILRKRNQHVDLRLEPIRPIRLLCSCSAERFFWATNYWKR